MNGRARKCYEMFCGLERKSSLRKFRVRLGKMTKTSSERSNQFIKHSSPARLKSQCSPKLLCCGHGGRTKNFTAHLRNIKAVQRSYIRQTPRTKSLSRKEGQHDKVAPYKHVFFYLRLSRRRSRSHRFSSSSS